METGGVGDGWSWAEQVKAGTKEEWRRDRPTKQHWSSPRRCDIWSPHPFPLQDSEGRHEAIQQLYHHAGEHALTCHDVTAQGIATHHPDLEAGVTKSPNNMVLYDITVPSHVPQPRPLLHQPGTPRGG